MVSQHMKAGTNALSGTTVATPKKIGEMAEFKKRKRRSTRSPASFTAMMGQRSRCGVNAKKKERGQITGPSRIGLMTNKKRSLEVDCTLIDINEHFVRECCFTV
jgi:hypothetical protein